MRRAVRLLVILLLIELGSEALMVTAQPDPTDFGTWWQGVEIKEGETYMDWRAEVISAYQSFNAIMNDLVAALQRKDVLPADLSTATTQQQDEALAQIRADGVGWGELVSAAKNALLASMKQFYQENPEFSMPSPEALDALIDPKAIKIAECLVLKSLRGEKLSPRDMVEEPACQLPCPLQLAQKEDELAGAQERLNRSQQEVRWLSAEIERLKGQRALPWLLVAILGLVTTALAGLLWFQRARKTLAGKD
jgi:hypothetical protein